MTDKTPSKDSNWDLIKALMKSQASKAGYESDEEEKIPDVNSLYPNA